jgi:hypothetical protein
VGGDPAGITRQFWDSAESPARSPKCRVRIEETAKIHGDAFAIRPSKSFLMQDVAMKLRPATPADLELLRRWDEQAHVIASDPNDDWGWETELGRSPDWREQLIAEVDGRSVGFVQIIDPATRGRPLLG